MKKLILGIVLTAVTVAMECVAEEDAGFVRVKPDAVQWQDIGMPGIRVAFIEGHPDREGFYLLRGKFAPGTFTAPHYHSTDRHVTVIAGTWYTGTGSLFDKDNTVPLSPGSYMKHPAMAVHYDGAKDEEVIVEIKGIGPAKTVFLDQPRN